MSLVLMVGCDELSARRKIQEADKLYQTAQFAKKCEDSRTLCSKNKHCEGIKGGTCTSEMLTLYEDALALQPDLDIGHHNAALAYMKMFKRGDKDPENMTYADGATRHFQKYLESNPKDGKIVGLMTTIWLDSGQYKRALAYWEAELAKDSKNLEVLQILASINWQAGRWQEAVSWHHKIAGVESEPEAKVAAYIEVAKLTWNRLRNRDKIKGAERVFVADVGIAALQKAVAIDPPGASLGDNEGKKTLLSLKTKKQVQSYLASHYNFRASAHGVSWARAVDAASTNIHAKFRTALSLLINKEAALEKAKEAAAQAGSDASGKSDG